MKLQVNFYLTTLYNITDLTKTLSAVFVNTKHIYKLTFAVTTSRRKQ